MSYLSRFTSFGFYSSSWSILFTIYYGLIFRMSTSSLNLDR